MSAVLMQLQEVTEKALDHPGVLAMARKLLETIADEPIDHDRLSRCLFDLVAMTASVTASDTAYAILGQEEMDKILAEAMALEQIGNDNES
jgi:uncharacterized protein YyaL (SSP411 family)